MKRTEEMGEFEEALKQYGYVNFVEEPKPMDDEWKRPMETITKAMIMKKHMLAKGLTRAKAKCPYCDGFWHGVLCGHKKHLHMACDGNCKSIMME